jgi:hypothetical protein
MITEARAGRFFRQARTSTVAAASAHQWKRRMRVKRNVWEGGAGDAIFVLAAAVAALARHRRTNVVFKSTP